MLHVICSIAQKAEKHERRVDVSFLESCAKVGRASYTYIHGYVLVCCVAYDM